MAIIALILSSLPLNVQGEHILQVHSNILIISNVKMFKLVFTKIKKGPLHKNYALKDTNVPAPQNIL